MSFEVQMIGRRESRAPEKKSMAFNALTDGSDSNNDNDEEIAFMTINFRKFLKYRKMNNLKSNNYKNSGNQNVVPNNIKCFNCDETGHIKRDCPYLDRQNLPINDDSVKKRKRAFTAIQMTQTHPQAMMIRRQIIQICVS